MRSRAFSVTCKAATCKRWGIFSRLAYRSCSIFRYFKKLKSACSVHINKGQSARLHFNHHFSTRPTYVTFFCFNNELTCSLGTLKILKSLVTVPMMTAILPSRPSFLMLRANLANEMGGLLILDIKRRRSTISLNLASVRRAKKRYNCNRKSTIGQRLIQRRMFSLIKK